MCGKPMDVCQRINDIFYGERKKTKEKTAEKMKRQCRGIITINWSRLRAGI